MSDLIEVTRDDKRLNVSIPIEDMKKEEIEEILDYLYFRTILRKSKMTQEQANELADEVTASWWEANKSRILKLIGENE